MNLRMSGYWVDSFVFSLGRQEAAVCPILYTFTMRPLQEDTGSERAKQALGISQRLPLLSAMETTKLADGVVGKNRGTNGEF